MRFTIHLMSGHIQVIEGNAEWSLSVRCELPPPNLSVPPLSTNLLAVSISRDVRRRFTTQSTVEVHVPVPIYRYVGALEIWSLSCLE